MTRVWDNADVIPLKNTTNQMEKVMTYRILNLLCFLVLVNASTIAHGQDSFAKPIIDEATIGLVRGADSNAFAAYSKTAQKWSTHKFADYLKIKPYTLGEFREDNKNDLVIAFECTGGTVTELVAVDCNGQFCVHKLESAVNKDLKPVLNGGGVIYYINDEIVYAFSGRTGTWDKYNAPGLPNVEWRDGVGHVPSIQKHGFDTETKNGIVIKRLNGTAMFLAEKGMWQFTPTQGEDGG